MTKAKVKTDLIEIDGEENWCVKVKSGFYKDVVYKYVRVSVIEPESEDGFATLKFNYEVLYHAELPEEKIEGCSEFENMAGDILYDLIESASEKEKE